jgi:hypothetical protein
MSVVIVASPGSLPPVRGPSGSPSAQALTMPANATMANKEWREENFDIEFL